MGRDFVWGIFSGVRIYVSGKDYFNDDGEVVLKVGGKVASRDVRIVGKYVNGGVYVIIDDSVCWTVIRGNGFVVCDGVDDEVRM